MKIYEYETYCQKPLKIFFILLLSTFMPSQQIFTSSRLRSSVFIVNFEHLLQIFLESLLLTLNMFAELHFTLELLTLVTNSIYFTPTFLLAKLTSTSSRSTTEMLEKGVKSVQS